NAAESDEPRADQSRLLRSVVDFGDTLVREVMTPRPDIVAIRTTASIEELRKLVQEQEYSRLPVYTDNLDNIAGLVVVKDLIQMTDSGATRTVAEIMRPAAFVPETKRVADLLREFQQGRFQLAIVVDEYGGTAGLVTVEDVVEERVGSVPAVGERFTFDNLEVQILEAERRRIHKVRIRRLNPVPAEVEE